MAGYEKMNIGAWTALQKINKCIYGCKKFKEPLYVDKGYGGKILNPTYLAHIKETHGLHPMTFVDMIADMLYKDEKLGRGLESSKAFLESRPDLVEKIVNSIKKKMLDGQDTKENKTLNTSE